MAEKEESKVWAFLAYLLSVVGIVLVLAFRKKDGFAVYHSQQSAALIIFLLLVYVASLVPVVGQIVSIAGWAIFIILWVQGMVNALTGQKKRLWIIGVYADRIKF